jgi:DNA-directed RNA polymerase subunit F
VVEEEKKGEESRIEVEKT